LIGSTELGYQLIHLLRPNMVNEHSQQSELKVFFSREQPSEKNGLGSEFKLSRNSNSVTNKHHQQRPLTQVKID